MAKAATNNNWGLSLFDSEDWEGAKDKFQEAIQAELASLDQKSDSSDLAFYYNNLGLCFYHLARPQDEDQDIMKQAIRNYNAAIDANNQNPIHFFNRGNVHLNLQ